MFYLLINKNIHYGEIYPLSSTMERADFEYSSSFLEMLWESITRSRNGDVLVEQSMNGKLPVLSPLVSIISRISFLRSS